MWYEYFINRGIIPEKVIRFIVRLILREYADKIDRSSFLSIKKLQKDFVDEAAKAPIALATDLANNQHYEIDTSLYQQILGTTLKYSGSYWTESSTGLDQADELTLKLYIQRADIHDFQYILELGSGWGSLSLNIAEQFPNTKVTTVTNSVTQKAYIEGRIAELDLGNISVVHADINDFHPTIEYDRIISIEMFEHLRNPAQLLGRIDKWLNPGGKLFIQVFSHRCYPQFFDNIKTSWMARNFFTAGMMPYDGFYEQIIRSLRLSKKWRISGVNYHISLEAWLHNLRTLIKTDSGGNQRLITLNKSFYNKYAIFLIICSELFRYNDGKDWYLVNYLFVKPKRKSI